MVSRKTQGPAPTQPPEEAMDVDVDVDVERPQTQNAESSSSATAAAPATTSTTNAKNTKNTKNTPAVATVTTATPAAVPPLRPLTRSLTGRASKPRARDDSWYTPPKKSPAPRKKASASSQTAGQAQGQGQAQGKRQGRKRTYEEMDRAESEEPTSGTSTPKPPPAQGQGGGGVPPLNSTQAIFVDVSSGPFPAPSSSSSFPFSSASSAPGSGTRAGPAVAGANVHPPHAHPPHAHPNPYHNPTRARTNLPIPVPNLIKKSRGRRVPVVASLAGLASPSANSASSSAPGSTPGSSTNGGAGDANGTAAGGGGAPNANGAGGGIRGDDEKSKRLHICKVEGCGKCFHRGEHLKRHIRSIHTHEKREFPLRAFCFVSAIRRSASYPPFGVFGGAFSLHFRLLVQGLRLLCAFRAGRASLLSLLSFIFQASFVRPFCSVFHLFIFSSLYLYIVGGGMLRSGAWDGGHGSDVFAAAAYPSLSFLRFLRFPRSVIWGAG
ncbi:hypothetical protein C8R47DRAFT_614272 [Mycena vitilis]|nr:hypothetical protein C8R47DRAFT_614272 [Mycena vitilis]